jgi:hypothetical protein
MWKAIYVTLETIGVFTQNGGEDPGLTSMGLFDPGLTGVTGDLDRSSGHRRLRAAGGGGHAGVRRRATAGLVRDAIELYAKLRERQTQPGTWGGG